MGLELLSFLEYFIKCFTIRAFSLFKLPFLGIFTEPVLIKAMIFVQTILVKSYLLKYLSSHQPTDPFHLSEKNRFGIFIINSLRFSEIKRSKKYSIQGKTEKMRILIKEHYERSFGINISAMHQYRFNAMLLDEFHDRMLDFVVTEHTGQRGDIKIALHKFCEKYDITEDDLPFRTLQKMWERESYRVSDSISM